MAQIDIKKAVVTVFDGTPNVAALTSASGANGLVTVTSQPHLGSLQVLTRVVFLNPAAPTVALSVAVVGETITVTLQTDGGSVIISTATQVAAAINANASAFFLVSAVAGGTGGGLVDARAATALLGVASYLVVLGEGTFSWTETQVVQYTRNRGILYSTRLGDQQPVEVKFDAMWEFVTGSGSYPITILDALKKVGGAAAWISSDTADPCQPYSVDLEVHYTPQCSPTKDEFILLPLFRWEKNDADLKGGNFGMNGKCNVLNALSRRF